jgi:hypothetical protein
MKIRHEREAMKKKGCSYEKNAVDGDDIIFLIGIFRVARS